MNKVDELCINTLRFLAVDQVERAKSGHPGTPLGIAPTAYVIWDRFLHHNPRDTKWFNRDRFLLSPGHACAILYALLHVYGYGLSIEDLKQFRQWGSKTPGHPEYGLVPGVEATTGPLGQGVAMGVGMAMAEELMAGFFNKAGFPIVDHYTYVIVSDGDLMEGISAEAASLAGTLHLRKLIYFYDDNHISIEGSMEKVFAENMRERFEAYGWYVQEVADGNDVEAVDRCIRQARNQREKPSLIVVRTHIGYGSPKQDTAEAHGEPLGPEAAKATKIKLGWPLEPTFYVPEEAANHFHQALERGARWESEWKELFENYRREFPDLAQGFEEALRGQLPQNWHDYVPSFKPEQGPMATRDASGKVMNQLTNKLHATGGAPHHFIVGGSADLAPSTKTLLLGYGDFDFESHDPHNFHFGVREHAMAAISNGIALHNRFIPYAATFLIFSDYMRPALRLSALMKTHVIFIFTHDSIALGEDGPTHQPIEQLMSLRAMPNMTVIRPADANETAIAWQIAVERKGPVALALTRQKLPILDPQIYPVREGAVRGAYILTKTGEGKSDVILVATGSEVHLALASLEELKSKGLKATVVSMPSWEIFQEQPSAYRGEVLSADVPKVSIEAGATLGWRDIVGDTGDVIGLDRFGASAPGQVVYEKLGFNKENVVKHVLKLLHR